MSTIDIRHPHSLSPAQARESVQRLAETLSSRFGVQYGWTGDDLLFERSGIDGRVRLEPGALRVTAKLGLLFGAMKGSIEAEIRKVLGERFG
ncbi:MAG: polyhydroxyalkanoic acid synthase [Lysobacter sp.]|nr:MAG: polyhydroxyalkanoic acid synthase [Lysobacter sp.]